jgi:hypothetical protein
MKRRTFVQGLAGLFAAGLGLGLRAAAPAQPAALGGDDLPKPENVLPGRPYGGDQMTLAEACRLNQDQMTSQIAEVLCRENEFYKYL